MILCVTKCGQDKRRNGSYPPDILYTSKRIQEFTKFCKENSLNWAILSAEYGLSFPDEKFTHYDTIFKSEKGLCQFLINGELLDRQRSEIKFEGLLNLIKSQIKTSNISRILFFDPSEEIQKSKCYLLILHMALDNCNEHHSTFKSLISHIESLSNGGRLKIVHSLNELNSDELNNDIVNIDRDWLRKLKIIIETYHKNRKIDPFMKWYKESEKNGIFKPLFEKVMIIIIDARFDQGSISAEAALENTKQVFRANLIRDTPVNLDEIPDLTPPKDINPEIWRQEFEIAHKQLISLVYEIIKTKKWDANALTNKIREVRYLGPKTSRLAVRWLYELIPEIMIDMKSFQIPVDQNLYRVAARLGIVNPYTDKYIPGVGGSGDLKIQKFAQELFPNHPYLIDEPMWFEGRSSFRRGHCFLTNPEHNGCIFEEICPKKYLDFDPYKVGIKVTPIFQNSESKKSQKIKNLMKIIDEIVEDCIELSKENWAKISGLAGKLYGSGIKLKKIMKEYADKGEIKEMMRYYENAINSTQGKKIDQLLRECNKKSLETEYSRFKRIFEEIEKF